MTTLAPSSVAALPPALTPSQRGELELARARAERAAAGRARGPSSGAFITAPAAANTDPGSGAAPKRPRGVGSGGGGDASVVNSDDDDGVEHSDGELELSRLSPEEQERVLTARLARGWGSANHKDARRLKRCVLAAAAITQSPVTPDRNVFCCHLRTLRIQAGLGVEFYLPIQNLYLSN